MNDIAPLGHNKPPEPTERERVKLEHKAMFDQGPKFVDSMKATPEKIDTDEVAAQISDNIRATRKWAKKMDELRKEAGEELRRKKAEVDATFNNAVEPVLKSLEPVAERHEAYLKRRRDEESRKLEEKAKASRLEAEAQQRAAETAQLAKEAALKAEADARAREEQAKLKREDEERKAAQAKLAKEAAEKAEREAIERRLEQERKDRADCDTKLALVKDWLTEAEQLLAGERSESRDAELALLLEEGGTIASNLQFIQRRIDVLHESAKFRLARFTQRLGLFLGEYRTRRTEDLRKANVEADAKREAERQERRRLQGEADEREAAEREAKRKADEDAAEEARQRRIKAETDEANARAAAKAAKAEIGAAAAEAKTAVRDQKGADRVGRKAQDEAGRAEDAADKIDRKLDGAPGEMVQVRGDYGAIGTLARRWTVQVDSIEELDLEKLRHLINPDALQAAAWRYLQSGGRDLRGATIKQIEDGRVI